MIQKMKNRLTDLSEPVEVWVCERELELSDIPTKTFGSVAFVIETGHAYLCDSQQNWVENTVNLKGLTRMVETMGGNSIW